MDVRELSVLLISKGVPTEQWGRGKAKNLSDLFEEIRDGESKLEMIAGALTRHLEACAINVFADIGGSRKRLVELKQILSDGRERVRNLDTSLGEKLRPGEAPNSAARRALREELGIDVEAEFVSQLSLTRGPQESESFPGLPSVYVFHRFDILLPNAYVAVNGYVIKEKNKTVHYGWQ